MVKICTVVRVKMTDFKMVSSPSSPERVASIRDEAGADVVHTCADGFLEVS